MCIRDRRSVASILFTASGSSSDNTSLTISAKDFIAGWDFYKSAREGRTADFAAADNDVDQLIPVSYTHLDVYKRQWQ